MDKNTTVNLVKSFKEYSNTTDNQEVNNIFKKIGDHKKHIPLNNENNKEMFSIIKSDNINMAKKIINDTQNLTSLTKEYKLILAEILNNDKLEGQEYIQKMLENSDDELILLLARNKKIYHNLSRDNKAIINQKLLTNPWLLQNNSLDNSEEQKKFRSESMKKLFDTQRKKSIVDLLTDL